MKKEERLHRLFGEIDDDLVADAAHRPISLKVWLPRVTATAAAVALTVGLAVTQPWNREPLPVDDGTDTTTQTTTTQLDNGGADTTTQNQTEQTEIGLVPPLSTSPNQPVDPTTTTAQTTTVNLTTIVKPTDTTATDADTDVDDTAPEESTTTDSVATTTVNLTTTVKLPYTTIVGAPTTTAPTEGGIWYEPHWEDKPIWQRFPEFERFGQSHTVRDITIDKAMVEEHLENVFLRGYDIYTDTEYEIEGQIYRIKGIHPDCAVALQYPGRTDFFPATNSGYRPETLGQFISDLNLREHLRVGTVYHSYRDADGTFHDKEYAGLTVEKVWEMLLSDDALSNEYDETDWQRQWNNKISIRIDMPLLGYNNISLSLSEDGYLRTNLLDTEKLFHIGKDKVDAFMAYVEGHCRLQKDDELIPMPDDTNAVGGTTRTSPAQPPLETGTTVWNKSDD